MVIPRREIVDAPWRNIEADYCATSTHQSSDAGLTAAHRAGVRSRLSGSFDRCCRDSAGICRRARVRRRVGARCALQERMDGTQTSDALPSVRRIWSRSRASTTNIRLRPDGTAPSSHRHPPHVRSAHGYQWLLPLACGATSLRRRRLRTAHPPPEVAAPPVALPPGPRRRCDRAVVTVENGLVRATFSNRGGTLVNWQLPVSRRRRTAAGSRSAGCSGKHQKPFSLKLDDAVNGVRSTARCIAWLRRSGRQDDAGLAHVRVSGCGRSAGAQQFRLGRIPPQFSQSAGWPIVNP